MVTLDALVRTIVYLVVAGLVAWLLWWLIDYLQLPEPFNKVAHVVVAVFSVLVCIAILLALTGTRLIAL